jgi:hypothetical protein
MALPLPKVVADVEAGGPFVTSARGLNALRQSQLQNKISGIEAQYKPLTTQAEAASKLAYANLMGPQFLAKIMQSDPALANLTDEQKKQAMASIYQAGTGQGSGASIFGQMNMPQQNSNQGQGVAGNAINWLMNKLTNNQSAPQPQNQLMQPSGVSPQPSNMGAPMPNTIKKGFEPLNQLPYDNGMGNDFTGNIAAYKGRVKEGEEAGSIRAKDIKDLNDSYFSGQNTQTTLDSLSDILGSKDFENIKQMPLAGHHELSYYSKFGTPEQQNMVGQYYTLTGNVIKDSARDFAGAFRKGEQQLLQGMKPNPSDTVDAARGKTESLSVINKMLMERSRLTSQLMNKYHINKLDAQEMADKQINGPQIRKEIHNKLNPTITIRNRKTGKTMTIPAGQASKYGVNNV